LGEGLYFIQLLPSRHGPFSLRLDLGATIPGGNETLTLDGTARCSADKVPLEDGSCGCMAEREPRDGRCQPCRSGMHKPGAGDAPCQDTPLDVLAFFLGGAGLVLGSAALYSSYLRMERRRRYREEQLERNFLAVTYHEVRNPLNGTVGWLRELSHAEDEIAGTQVRTISSEALLCTEVALNFLNSLSMIFKLEAKQLTPKFERTRLFDCLQKIASIARPQTQAGVPFLLEASDVEELEVMCDTSMLIHVLLNLCQNAARFTTKGSVSLTCERRPARNIATAGSAVQSVFFAVRDAGPGMSPQVKAGLFRRYKSQGGTGIGLFLSYQLVISLGSKIEVVSPWAASGASGTSFEFTLLMELPPAQPKQIVSSSLIELTPTHRSAGIVEESTPVMIEVPPDPVALPPNLRALIADDRVTNRTVLRAAFERFGWEVTDVNVAEEVLSRVLQKGERYDILVLDERFEGQATSTMAGSEAIKQLKSKLVAVNGNRTAPVIVSCSGSVGEGVTFQDEIARLFAAGADLVWSKPFPDWRAGGPMQRQLARQLALKRADSIMRASTSCEARTTISSAVLAARDQQPAVPGRDGESGHPVGAAACDTAHVSQLSPSSSSSLPRHSTLPSPLGLSDGACGAASVQPSSSSSPPWGSEFTSLSGPTADANQLEMPRLPKDVRVLVADDIAINRRLFKRIFSQQFGWHVTEAETAEKALELLLEKGERHDLILMDENFGRPDLMFGSEAIARLRARVGHEVVIIHCSGNNSEQQPPSDGSISSIAADDFWGKPMPDWRNGDMQRRLARLLAPAQPK